MTTQKTILLFDGECKFCNFWVGLIQRQKAQHRFCFFALQSQKGKELQAKYNVDRNIDSVIVIEGNKVYYKSNAAFVIAKLLGGFWYLTLVLWLIPKPIRNWLYDVAAKNRYRFFNKKSNCDFHN